MNKFRKLISTGDKMILKPYFWSNFIASLKIFHHAFWNPYFIQWKSLSLIQLLGTPWTIPMTMEFSRPEYWSSLSLLQGIFPTQGLSTGLWHCSWILYQLSHKRSPRILEWVADPFSSRSSQPRNWTRVSCTAGRFFTNWAIREAHFMISKLLRPRSIYNRLQHLHAFY